MVLKPSMSSHQPKILPRQTEDRFKSVLQIVINQHMVRSVPTYICRNENYVIPSYHKPITSPLAFHCYFTVTVSWPISSQFKLNDNSNFNCLFSPHSSPAVATRTSCFPNTSTSLSLSNLLFISSLDSFQSHLVSTLTINKQLCICDQEATQLYDLSFSTLLTTLLLCSCS